MNQETKDQIAQCLITAAEKRRDKVAESSDPYQTAHEQFGIAFVANNLYFADLIDFSAHKQLDEIRADAFKIAGESL